MDFRICAKERVILNEPNISFVIIEYHSVPDIDTCAAAISRACKNLSFEIIVSSNSTYPVSEQKRLKEQFSDLTWVFNPSNGGFAHGMNSGLTSSCGNVVVILNPDVRIKSGDLAKAYEYLLSQKDVGVIGPRIVDGIGNLQDTCRAFMSPLTLFNRILARIFTGQDVLINSEFDYTRIQSVDWVIGAFMMVSRDALKSVGGLDEGYFLYVEDMDWCKRFWDNGYQVVYYPLLEVEYKGDRKSTSALFSKKMVNKYGFYHLKSYMRFLKKHGLNPSRSSSSKRGKI